jgi:hypothetical protein
MAQNPAQERIKLVSLSEITPNPDNPRAINSSDYEKLKKSISDFPKMLELRPLVVNDDNMILGGNQRYYALLELGFQEAYVLNASDLTEEEQRQFVIKDNASFGDWDWEILENQWNTNDLIDWGVNVPEPSSLFQEEETPEESEQQQTPGATHDDYSVFELIMYHENKLEFLRVLNSIKEAKNFEKLEDCVMHLCGQYELQNQNK